MPATAIGLLAVLMWALLGALSAAAGPVPPLLLIALCFAASGAGGVVWLLASGRGLGALRQPALVWLVGIGGLFGFHTLYFTAIQNAPPVEANLINYMWPLLIVLFSGLLPGERLRAHHLAGVLLGFLGAGLLILSGSSSAAGSNPALGYAAALGSALVWALYSIASRRLQAVPTAAVAGFCLGTGLLSGLLHLAVERTAWPMGPVAWTAVALLAALPLGLAFFVWDIGMKRGNVQVLGAAAYAAPVLSTFVLIAAGYGAFTPAVGLATLLVASGAVLAAKDVLFGRGGDRPARPLGTSPRARSEAARRGAPPDEDA